MLEPGLRAARLTEAAQPAYAAGTDPRPIAGPPPAAPAARTAVTGGYAWTGIQDDELRDAAAAGIGLDDLAEHFDRPGEVIAARLALLGLDLDQPRLTLDQ